MSRISLPNQVTLARLVLAVAFFVLLSQFDAHKEQELRWLLVASFWVFLVAALTDVVDGLLARWLDQVTSLGRMLDPVVDKVMVCAAFVFFVSDGFARDGQNITGVRPWMVIVILVRELLISGLRVQAESAGRNFAATFAGKLKMFIQSATVCVILGQLGWNLTALEPLRTGCIWLTVIVTALSTITYLRRAQPLLATAAAPPSVGPGPAAGSAAVEPRQGSGP
jgi:CDP-diacylglycerol--glycerol-3-phosphate 3-phosphatidyltransferase